MLKLKNTISYIILCLSINLITPNFAGSEEALDSIIFSSKEDAERYNELTHKLRCLVCQNQSLAASDADLAKDLKNEVYGMVNSGKSNEEIIAFLVNRYGDFVLYKPPVKRSTYILWFAPGLLFIAGLFYIVSMVNKNKKISANTLTEEEKKKVAELLNNGEK